MKKILSVLWKNIFWIAAFISLIIPDIMLRGVHSNVFAEPFRRIVPWTFTLGWTSLILICALYLSKSWGRMVYMVMSSLFLIFSFSNYVYYKIFNQFYWLENIALSGEATNYFRYTLQFLDIKLVVLTIITLALMVLAGRHWQSMRGKLPGTYLLIPISIIIIAHLFMIYNAQPEENDDTWNIWNRPKSVYVTFTDPNRSMNITGIYHYAFRNIYKMAFPSIKVNDDEYEKIDKYFKEEKPAAKDNGNTGLFEGKNVIMVMMESLDDWMIDDKYTPTISHMMKNGINFTDNYAATFGTGYTFNTEFAVNSGYHAMVSGMSVTTLSKNTYEYSLPNLFKAKGYTPTSFHFNSPDFYNRGIMHKAWGYESYVSFSDYMPGKEAQLDSNIISNDKVFEKMTENKKFFDFIITYSAHVPYTYDDDKLLEAKEKYPELIDTSQGTDPEINNAKILAHDTDEFFRILTEKLEAKGILDDTVIIAFADHFTYGVSSWDKLYALSDVSTAKLLEKTPLFIYCSGMTPVKISKVTNTLDILPTVANLFGLEKTNYYMGFDAFDNDYKGFVYFSDGSWYDGKHYYIEEEMSSIKDNVEYFNSMSEMFRKREEMNDAVLRSDYFKKVAAEKNAHQ